MHEINLYITEYPIKIWFKLIWFIWIKWTRIVIWWKVVIIQSNPFPGDGIVLFEIPALAIDEKLEHVQLFRIHV